MTDAIVTLANEFQDKDEQIDRLTAERDSFKTCYDISYREAARLRNLCDRQREEIANMQRQLAVAFGALYKSQKQISTAINTINQRPEHKEEVPPSAVTFGSHPRARVGRDHPAFAG
jgi:septal ring factor EnvC (AmiA/AmiB activator)